MRFYLPTWGKFILCLQLYAKGHGIIFLRRKSKSINPMLFYYLQIVLLPAFHRQTGVECIA